MDIPGGAPDLNAWATRHGVLDREHERLMRHQLERDITWRYLADFLPAQGPSSL